MTSGEAGLHILAKPQPEEYRVKSTSIINAPRISLKDVGLLLLLTCGAILVHGYHPYVEDAEIYVPGIKKILNPALYPYNQGFFASHARLTLFPNLIAGSIKSSHLPVDWGLALWHFASVFLLLLACWHLGRLAFRDPAAKWGGVALVASLLTIPVAGTALYIMDQYLNPRSLSTPAVLFIIINVIEHRFERAVLWTLFTAAIHPLMIVFGVTYAVILLGMQRSERQSLRSSQSAAAVAAFLPLGLFPPVTDAYREVLDKHPEFFLLRWQWYEWLGLVAPIGLLWWFSRIAGQKQLPTLRLLCRALAMFQLFFLVLSLAITVPARFANFAELQPMRSLHLTYVMLFGFAGGLLAQFLLRDRWWRWLLLFAPLCAGMYFAQRELFPATPHIEWPGGASGRNDWVAAFQWIRQNTPLDAYFALNPEHMEVAGEDYHGFRAIAERSMLADRVKDSGVVTMFPSMGAAWQEQVRAQNGWRNFQAKDLLALQQRFGVNWVVLEEPALPSLNCPYKNPAVLVCRLN
jgi:hypothetical protein